LDANEAFPGRTIDLEFAGRRITLPQLLEASERLLGILIDVDARTTEKPGGTIDWVIADLRPGSAHITLEAEPRGEETPLWAPVEVVMNFKRGMKQVIERGERPPYFSERAMQRAFELTKILDINGIEAFRIGYNGEAVEITPGMKKAVKETLEGKYKAIGSIEGRIESLSDHDSPSCTIWTLLTGEPIRCTFADPGLVTLAHRYFKERVTVRGVLTSRADGEVTSMRARSIEPFPDDSELPTVDDILGIMANGT
jgi:hypothetical protein